ncbi:hypothetical protein BJ875DRAFT_506797 [Amylocarpus encephaloides]|uniref:DUF7719 domain-containing protein n=1 Tax=Amylocarpus encephaloides TaxID=45428 RepID=A0A9P7YC88_9HELO|nr:hypothetical protein BJ875DRAFT_506797 [Amylocarpus encephaloides]
MVQTRKERRADFKLKHPDRSSRPSEETLLGLAEKTGILDSSQITDKQEEVEEDEVLVGRLGESFLWSVSLTMLHFTLDVLVMSQYAEVWEWKKLLGRTAQAFPVFLLLFYSFHPHKEASVLLPRLPPSMQPILHQLFFFVCSVSAGCYLVHITNAYGYYAIMKQSPPLGCIWIWSVIEQDVFWATGSLVICGIFLKAGGYAIM